VGAVAVHKDEAATPSVGLISSTLKGWGGTQGAPREGEGKVGMRATGRSGISARPAPPRLGRPPCIQLTKVAIDTLYCSVYIAATLPSAEPVRHGGAGHLMRESHLSSWRADRQTRSGGAGRGGARRRDAARVGEEWETHQRKISLAYLIKYVHSDYAIQQVASLTALPY